MYIYVGRKYVIYWPPPVPYILEENGWKNFFLLFDVLQLYVNYERFFYLKNKKI